MDQRRGHRRSTSGAIVYGLLALATFCRTAHAVPVVLHEGQLDPVDEGWALTETGDVSTSSGVENTASGAHQFRAVTASGTGAGSGADYYYPKSPSEIPDFSRDWRLEAIVRVVDAPTCTGCADFGNVGVVVYDGLNYWSFYFGNSNAGPVSDSGKTGPHSLLLSHAIDTRTDYHRYEIKFSQNGAGPEDDTADFVVDGALVFDDVGRSGLWTAFPEQLGVIFGTVTLTGASAAHWERVLLDVPELTACASLGIALGLLGLSRDLRARRHRCTKPSPPTRPARR